MSHATQHQAKINSVYPRCVDGRRAEVYLEWSDTESTWIVGHRGPNAHAELGPQFLGGALVFVKALEAVEGWEREQAFDLVNKAFAEVGLKPQLHVDDKHGDHNFGAMADEELVELVDGHHTGCGYAKYAWGEEADTVIQEAKDHHWRVQMLTGEHSEKGAILNLVEGTTFDTSTAVSNEVSHFNTDVAAARPIFEKLGEFVHSETFAKEAEEWMITCYKEVVVLLKGVPSEDKIEVLE